MSPLALLPALLLAVSLVACTGVEGSGTKASETRSVKPFSEAELDGALDLQVHLGKPSLELRVSGDDNLLPLVETESNGRRLLVRSKKPLRPKLGLGVAIAAPDIKLVRTRGAAKIAVDGVDNARFQLDCEGACTATLEGACQKLKIFVKGAGKVDALGLQAKEALVVIEGSGSIELEVSDALEARIWGTGSIRYRGKAKVTREIKGAGTIQPK